MSHRTQSLARPWAPDAVSLDMSHGCVGSVCLRASSRAHLCPQPRRHPLQCHQRGDTGNRAPRGRVRPYVRACRSRLPQVQRDSVIVIMRGLGSQKGITSTRLRVTWRWPWALPVACLRCNCHSRRTLPRPYHGAQSWHAPIAIRPRRPANQTHMPSPWATPQPHATPPLTPPWANPAPPMPPWAIPP
jgi:hypothetical protein